MEVCDRKSENVSVTVVEVCRGEKMDPDNVRIPINPAGDLSFSVNFLFICLGTQPSFMHVGLKYFKLN